MKEHAPPPTHPVRIRLFLCWQVSRLTALKALPSQMRILPSICQWYTRVFAAHGRGGGCVSTFRHDLSKN